MKILGIDWGKKTIGLALSESGLLARELPEMKNNLDELISLIKNENVEKIVIGLPTMPNGRQGRQAAQVKKFGSELSRSSGVPVVYEDEAFTSEEAESLGGSHSLAARLILEQYLNRMTND